MNQKNELDLHKFMLLLEQLAKEIFTDKTNYIEKFMNHLGVLDGSYQQKMKAPPFAQKTTNKQLLPEDNSIQQQNSSQLADGQGARLSHNTSTNNDSSQQL